MATKVRVLFADISDDFRFLLDRAAENDGRIEVLGSTPDGMEALKIITEMGPDIIILDLALSNLDGLSLLRRLIEEGVSLRILVTSKFYNDLIMTECAELGVDYFIPKPCNASTVLNQAISLVCAPETPIAASQEVVLPIRERSLEAAVSEILHEIGIPPHMKGYPYVREAIVLTVRDMNLIHTVTKGLYPAVAGKYSTTATCVERAIRSGIESAQKRGNTEAMKKYFGSKLFGNKTRPTNAEFIAAIADYLNLLNKEWN